MLLRVEQLKQIMAGVIFLVFRRWRKPKVKTGGTLKTAVGLLAIDSVQRCAMAEIRPPKPRKPDTNSPHEGRNCWNISQDNIAIEIIAE